MGRTRLQVKNKQTKNNQRKRGFFWKDQKLWLFRYSVDFGFSAFYKHFWKTSIAHRASLNSSWLWSGVWQQRPCNTGLAPNPTLQHELTSITKSVCARALWTWFFMLPGDVCSVDTGFGGLIFFTFSPVSFICRACVLHCTFLTCSLYSWSYLHVCVLLIVFWFSSM